MAVSTVSSIASKLPPKQTGGQQKTIGLNFFCNTSVLKGLSPISSNLFIDSHTGHCQFRNNVYIICYSVCKAVTGLRKQLTEEVEFKGLLKLPVSGGKSGADAEQVSISGEAEAGKDCRVERKMRDD